MTRVQNQSDSAVGSSDRDHLEEMAIGMGIGLDVVVGVGVVL